MLASRQAMNSPIQIEHDGPDIVVFGHEHRVIVQRHSGVLFVNPGSPTFLHYRRGLGTIGILDVDSGEAQVRVLQL
jgi:predicted phosphodiesterase